MNILLGRDQNGRTRARYMSLAATLVWMIGLSHPTHTAWGSHMTPSLVLMRDEEALAALLPNCHSIDLSDTRFPRNKRKEIQKRWGWKPDRDIYRFHTGLDSQGHPLGTVLFLTEYTMQGPIRVAVGMSPDGKIRGAKIIEMAEEIYPWLEPLIREGFPAEFVGLGSEGSFVVKERSSALSGDLSRPYAQVVADCLRKGAILYEAGYLLESVPPTGPTAQSSPTTNQP